MATKLLLGLENTGSNFLNEVRKRTISNRIDHIFNYYGFLIKNLDLSHFSTPENVKEINENRFCLIKDELKMNATLGKLANKYPIRYRGPRLKGLLLGRVIEVIKDIFSRMDYNLFEIMDDRITNLHGTIEAKVITKTSSRNQELCIRDLDDDELQENEKEELHQLKDLCQALITLILQQMLALLPKWKEGQDYAENGIDWDNKELTERMKMIDYDMIISEVFKPLLLRLSNGNGKKSELEQREIQLQQRQKELEKREKELEHRKSVRDKEEMDEEEAERKAAKHLENMTMVNGQNISSSTIMTQCREFMNNGNTNNSQKKNNTDDIRGLPPINLINPTNPILSENKDQEDEVVMLDKTDKRSGFHLFQSSSRNIVNEQMSNLRDTVVRNKDNKAIDMETMITMIQTGLYVIR